MMKIVECFLCLLAVMPSSLDRLPIDYENHTWESSSRFRRQLGSVFENNCGTPLQSVTALIVGGESVSRGEFPWVVILFLKTLDGIKYQCGASLVSKEHVLTAAHCTYKNNGNDFLLKLGMHNIQEWADKNVKLATVKNIQYHPEFESSEVLQRDIAILVMENPIEYSQYIIPVCLWEGNDDLSNIVGQRGTVVGWGRDENGLRTTQEPRKITIPVVSTDTCRASSYEFHFLTNNMTICAGDKNMTGPCHGDSGGGLYINKNGRWMIRGIVSNSLQSNQTCDLSEYIIFADAAKYNPWIKQVIDVCKSTSCDLSDCKLPERPISGSYSVLDVFSISLQPGDTVPEQTVLQYSCDDGTINNRTVTVCAKGSWNHKIECRSPSLTSHVTTTDALPTNLTSPHTEGFSTTTPSMVSLMNGTKHCYIRCEGEQHKVDVMRELLTWWYSLIFCSDVERMRELVKGEGYTALVIHEDMPTTQIDTTIQQFNVRGILIASPSLAPRIDMKRVTWCINYVVPTVEGYRHTVAREYLSGYPPLTISLVSSSDELEVVRKIQRSYGIHMEEIPRSEGIGQAVDDYREN